MATTSYLLPVSVVSDWNFVEVPTSNDVVRIFNSLAIFLWTLGGYRFSLFTKHWHSRKSVAPIALATYLNSRTRKSDWNYLPMISVCKVLRKMEIRRMSTIWLSGGGDASGGSSSGGRSSGGSCGPSSGSGPNDDVGQVEGVFEKKGRKEWKGAKKARRLSDDESSGEFFLSHSGSVVSLLKKLFRRLRISYSE